MPRICTDKRLHSIPYKLIALEKTMKRILIIAACLSALVLTAGCHTMSGAGQDIQAGGSALTTSAEKNAPSSVKHTAH